MTAAPAPSDALSRVESHDGSLDLGALRTALWRRRWWVILPTLLTLLLSAVAVQLITPSYKSTASLLLQSQQSAFTRPTVDTQPQADPVIDDQAVTSQVQLILSRDLGRQAADRLKLAGNAEFDPLADGQDGFGALRRFLLVIGLVKDPLLKSPQDRVLDAYADALSVYQVSGSRVINVEFTSRDPELAARAANTVTDLYLAAQQSAKRGESLDASEALSPQIDQLRQKVARAEAAVEDYRNRNGLFAGQNSNTLSNQQLTDISTQLSAARSQQADAQARAGLLRQLVNSNRPIEVSDVTNSELIRRLVEQRVALQSQLALESRTLLPGHPRIKELNAQLAGLEAQIAAEAQRVARSLETDARLAGARVASLTTQLDERKTEAASSNEQAVQLRALELEAKSDRDLLESYLSRYREASAQAAFPLISADARVISRAVPATVPYFPRKGPIVLIATLVVLVLSSVLVVSSELLSGPSAEAIPLRARAMAAIVPVPAEPTALVTVPRPVDLDLVDSTPEAPTPIVSESAGLAPTSVEQLARRILARGAASTSLLVTGPVSPALSGEAALGLARRLARENLRVMLVGPISALARDAASEEGTSADLADLVRGRASFMDVIRRDPASRVHLIDAGLDEPSDMPPLDGLPESVTVDLDIDPVVEHAQRRGFIIEALASTYEVVVLHDPHRSAAGPDAWTALLPACDLAVLVTVPGTAHAVQVDAEARLWSDGARDVVLLESEPADVPPADAQLVPV